MSRVSVVLPIRLESMLNLRLHWGSKSRKVARQREWALAVPRHPVPCRVFLTRIAPRELDGDNLQGAFKALRDGIAQRLGVDDRDPRVTWLYAQERGKPREYAVRVTIEGPADD